MRAIELLTWLTAHLGSLALILLTAWGIGSLFLRKISFDSAVEKWVFSSTLGLGLCGLVLFSLGLLGLLYRGVMIGLTWVGALMAGAELVRWQRGWVSGHLLRCKKLGWMHAILALGLTGLGLAYWAVLLVLSQYPPLDFDAVYNHLLLARTYLAEHRLVVHEGAGVPLLPSLNHLLFAWAMAVNDDVLTQMIQHAFMVLTAFGLYAWGRRRHLPELGMAAAVMWMATPLVIWLSKCAYVDLSLASFAFLGVYALGVFWDRGGTDWWLLGMALLGAAAGAKMPGLIFLALGGGLGLWACVKSRLNWRHLTQGWLCCLLIAGPFYAYIAYHTGDPVWPLFPQLGHGIWGSPSIVAWNKSTPSIGAQKTLLNLLLMPVHVVTHPDRFFDESQRGLFPLVIIWPVAWLLAWRDKSVRWWCCWSFAFTGFWFMSFPLLRFWVSALPMVILALCESIRWFVNRVWSTTAFQKMVWAGLMLWGLWYGTSYALAQIQSRGPLPTTPLAREQFLTKSLVGYLGVKYINEHAAPSDVAYVLNSSWLNYYLRPYVIDRNSILERPVPTFNWPADEKMVRQLEAQRVTWLVYCPANPKPWKLPISDPNFRPLWPPYQLVYEDPQLWVYRYSLLKKK